MRKCNHLKVCTSSPFYFVFHVFVWYWFSLITGFADIQINYVLPGDGPVTGDWNSDGVDTIGVYRNVQFMLRNENTIGFADWVFALGIPGDMPIAGNWDGKP